MNYYALVIPLVCCVAWMARPGRRPHTLAFDILPWVCIAGFLLFDGALGAVCAWTAIPFAYFSVRYNQIEPRVLASQGGAAAAE